MCQVRPTVETVGWPLTLRKRGRAGPKTPAASWVCCCLEGLAAVRVDARRVTGTCLGAGTTGKTGVDSAQVSPLPADAAWGRLAVSGPSG